MESAVDKHHAGNRAGKQHAVIKTNVPDADEYGPVKADVAMGRSTWRNLSQRGCSFESILWIQNMSNPVCVSPGVA